MSRAVKDALKATTDLPKNERAVVIAIAAHANENGDAWPAVATIAEYVGCSERTVQRIIAKLVTLGRLAWRKVEGIATRVYRIVVGATNSGPGVTSPGPGVTDQAAGGDTESANLSPEVVKPNEKKEARGARDWRRFIPKDKNKKPRGWQYPERQGAANPPSRSERCPVHLSYLAHNCGGCRVDALVGGN